MSSEATRPVPGSGGGRIRIFPDRDALVETAARLFAETAADAVAARGRFCGVLSGGSTPRPLYERLAGEPYGRGLPWERIHLFWGDERCVPPSDPRSNYGMVREVLLGRVPVPPENVHFMDGEAGPAHGAAAYEAELRRLFPGQRVPWFDLVLLGLGVDGHTASLFPGSPVLDVRDRLVVWDRPPDRGPERITLTLPVINQAGRILFLAVGEEKAGILARVLAPRDRDPGLPAVRVRPHQGELLWFVDRAAARRLAAVLPDEEEGSGGRAAV